MDIEELPNYLRNAIAEMKFNSTIINKELYNALDTANNHEEFIDIFRNKMFTLINEAKDAINIINGEF